MTAQRAIAMDKTDIISQVISACRIIRALPLHLR